VGRREHRQRFWKAIASGLSSEDAAVAAGVSPVVGTRWFREGGGMPTVSLTPPSGRYLSFAEREEIAILHAQDCGVREIAQRVHRSPSTISRELRRNAATRGGALEYRASTAQWHADRRARRPKDAKLATNAALRQYVQDRLAGMDHRGRRSCRGPAGPVDRSPAGASCRPPVGEVVEPGADLEPAPGRLPR
jgi:transposase